MYFCFQASQNYSQTPSKANHPSRYDYTSPVKTLRKAMAPKHSSEPDKRGNKKRVQVNIGFLDRIYNYFCQKRNHHKIL
jgi:hypothetical protein